MQNEYHHNALCSREKMHYYDWMNIYPTDARSVCAYYVHDKHCKKWPKIFSAHSQINFLMEFYPSYEYDAETRASTQFFTH